MKEWIQFVVLFLLHRIPNDPSVALRDSLSLSLSLPPFPSDHRLVWTPYLDREDFLLSVPMEQLFRYSIAILTSLRRPQASSPSRPQAS